MSNKPPFRTSAKIAFVIYGFTIFHVLTMLLAGYVWVFTGHRFPPFAHYDDGMTLFIGLSVAGAVASLFASIDPSAYGYRKNR